MIVLDGVSTVSSATPLGGWYAQTLGELLATTLTTAPDAELRQALEMAIGTVACQHHLTPGDAPAATVSVVRWLENRVDALVLADGPVVAVKTDGTVDAVRDDRLDRLISRYQEYTAYQARLRAGGGFNAPEHLKLLRTLREHQMRHLNRRARSAYWVAEAVPEAARHAYAASWTIDELAAVLAMTDGVSTAVEDYGLVSSWTELAERCRTQGPQQVVGQVHNAELADPDGARWPRYKRHDDKALAFLTPGGEA